MIQDVYGFPIDVEQYQDFGFIWNYGQPFLVQAVPEKGLVCFGIESPQYGKLCLRFAGAALSGGLAPDIAASILYQSMPIYQALYPHPALIKLQGHGPAAGGYAAIFRWPEGNDLHQPGMQQQLQRQPLLSSLRMIDSVFDFHLYAASAGYVPVGFSDACLTADLAAGTLTLCEIGLYRRLPAVNDQGRMYGASQFMSPEEYTLGAPLDALTAQYAMGALAFFFFGAYSSHERAAWMAGEELFRVADRACSPQREKRYPSLEAFVADWRKAAGKTV